MREPMRRTFGAVLIGMIVIATRATAITEYGEREEFGPVRKNERLPMDKRRALAYLPDRVYLLEKHQSIGIGFTKDEGVAAYQGNVESINRALAELALLPFETVKEIHLLPAPGLNRSA